MRTVIQRVTSAIVTVEGNMVAYINNGLLVLLGITHDDTEKEIDYLVNKIVNMRIFSDDDGKMNRSVQDIKGEICVVSQFTLYGDCKKGNRPSFVKAAKPDLAEKLYKLFIKKCQDAGVATSSGQFGAMMDIQLTNSGPITIILEK